MTLASSAGRSTGWCAAARDTTLPTTWKPNLDQLCWFVAAITGADIGQVRAWTQELDKDEDLIGELTRRLSANPFRSINAAPTPLGLCVSAGTPWSVRTEPEHVVETGTHLGLGSVHHRRRPARATGTAA